MSAPAREPLLTRQFLLASAAHFFHALSYDLYLHMPGFLKELGADEVAIGLISGATAATAIVVRPLLGRAMDAWGRRPMIVAGGALDTLVCALYLAISRLGPGVLAVRVGHGVAEAMLFAALFAFAADIVPASRRIEGIALFGVSGMLPYSLSSLLGDALLARSSYRTLFTVSAILSAAALLFSLPLREPAAPPDRDPPRGVGAALVQRDLLPLWWLGLAFAIVVAAPATFLKTFVMQSGAGSVGGFYSAYAASAIVMRVGFGSLPERLGPKRVLYPSLAATALGCALLALAKGAGAVVAAGLFFGLGHGYAFPILLGLVVTRARDSERGAALSIFTALFDGGTLLGAPLLGVVIRAEGYPAMFTAAAGIVAAGVAVFAVWDRGGEARVTSKV